jgi:hypothetical protein
VHTEEELMIARHTRRLLGITKDDHPSKLLGPAGLQSPNLSTAALSRARWSSLGFCASLTSSSCSDSRIAFRA